jgi:hypothetical protein
VPKSLEIQQSLLGKLCTENLVFCDDDDDEDEDDDDDKLGA